MNNTELKYLATSSYKIYSSIADRREHDCFTLYRARCNNNGYNGWYLRYIGNEYQPTCYDYYKVIKDIFNGEVNYINQKIKEIKVVLLDDYELFTMTPEWTEEEILIELSKRFRKG